MIHARTRQAIIKRVLTWYAHAKRDLPWRHTHNPYHIFVSEVMLQQTQVDRVQVKYREFLTLFPSTRSLAQASVSQVITAWKGLGYNRRALYVQKTAQAVEEKYQGVFPNTIEQLLTLPGIGAYTARAILSFAFQQPVAMMDTNHRRFYQRVFFGIEQQPDKELTAFADKVLPTDTAYDWNQALMDFGSSICTTRLPRCGVCPLQQYCKAYPDILSVRVSQKKKKQIPFKDTDRFVRGKIIDLLREKQPLRFDFLRKQFPHLDSPRYKRIIVQLEKDGLIKREKKAIMLP